MAKYRIVVIVAGVLCFNIFAVGGASSQDRRPPPPGAPHGDVIPALIGWHIVQNFAAQVISELTFQAVGDVKQRLREDRLPDVLKRYGVDPEMFHSAMQTRMLSITRQLAEKGFISADQEKEITDQVEKRAKAHAVIKRLIEKAIQDGSISQEEAQMLRIGDH